MICRYCGKELREHEVCDCQKSREAKTAVNKEQLDTQIQKLKGLPKKTLAMIGGAAAIFLLIIIIAVSGGKKINLNKYLDISCTGYDSVGRASYEFDTEAFLKDYGKKIKIKKKAKGELSWLNDFTSNLPAAEMMVSDCVSGTLSETSGLSNGDTITFTWNCNDEMAEEFYGCKLKYKDIEFKVEDLEPVDTFDPFAEIELIYSGFAPNGTVKVSNNSSDPIMQELYFQVTPNDGLSNGMTVEVSIEENRISYLADTYGRVPAATSQEFTVDGLGSYALTLGEISEDTMNAMKAQSEDVIMANIAQKWNDCQKLDALTYLGSYMTVPKDLETSNFKTYIYMVYKLQVHEYEPEEGLDDTFSHYRWVRFYNPIVMPDGTCSIDLSDYNTGGESFKREVTWESGFRDVKNLYYDGYESLDTLFNKMIVSSLDRYNYESTVEDVE